MYSSVEVITASVGM